MCGCPKQGHGFLTPYAMIFFIQDLMWEVIVRFVDIGGIVDHQCLKFIFILKKGNVHI